MVFRQRAKGKEHKDKKHANAPNALDEFVKVIRHATGQALVVHNKAFDDILAQTLRGPYTKLCAAMRLDAITHGDDHVEIIEIDLARNLPFSFGLNYSEFPNSCSFLQLAFFINVLDMLIDGGYVSLKQLRHLRLREPHGFTLQLDLNLRFTVIRTVKQDLAFV